MIDCGEGAQFRINKFGIRTGKLDHIFISHLHGDHFYGLIGLLTTFNLNWRERPINLYAPAAMQDIINIQLKHSDTRLRFDLNFHPLVADSPKIIFEDDTLTVETIILKHRVPTTGFLFREKKGLRKIIPEKIQQYNIPFEKIPGIKDGADFTDEKGKIIPNAELTTIPHLQRSYAYCSDTAYNESIVEQLKGIDVLYHEATFMEDNKERAQETFHSTCKQAATIAKKAGVKKLLIGHFSGRYENLEPLLAESREIFPETYLAEEGNVFEI